MMMMMMMSNNSNINNLCGLLRTVLCGVCAAAFPVHFCMPCISTPTEWSIFAPVKFLLEHAVPALIFLYLNLFSILSTSIRRFNFSNYCFSIFQN